MSIFIFLLKRILLLCQLPCNITVIANQVLAGQDTWNILEKITRKNVNTRS